MAREGTSSGEGVEMARGALIVVDMQKGFLEPGRPLYCGAAARKIVPLVVRLVESEMAKGSTIVFTQDTHTEDDLEFEMFPRHCVVGTEENDLVAELQALRGVRLPKTRYSAFFRTPLDAILRRRRVEEVAVCGVCTDICVLHTVADARNRDLPVTVYRDCVASFDPAAHRFALAHMRKILGAKIESLGRA